MHLGRPVDELGGALILLWFAPRDTRPKLVDPETLASADCTRGHALHDEPGGRQLRITPIVDRLRAVVLTAVDFEHNVLTPRSGDQEVDAPAKCRTRPRERLERGLRNTPPRGFRSCSRFEDLQHPLFVRGIKLERGIKPQLVLAAPNDAREGLDPRGA
jgi:hypothetical protein